MVMKFRGKALSPSRGSVVGTARVGMFLATPCALDSPSVIDAEDY